MRPVQALKEKTADFREHVRAARAMGEYKAAHSRVGAVRIGDLMPFATVIVALVVLLAIGSYLLGQIKDQVSDNNTTDVINTGISALQDMSNWVPILVIGVIAVLIIGLLVRQLFNLGDQTGGSTV